MAASRGPRAQARLLLTYGGLGRGRRRGPGRGAHARVAAAPWFSPARERRRLFSSSSSGLSAGSPGVGPGSGSSSPASAADSDPDFEPGPACGSPGAARRPWQRRLRARAPEEEAEEKEEEEEEKEEEAGAKENQPHCHVTERSWRLRARGQRPGPPLCSTPGPPPAPTPRSILAGLSPVRNSSPAASRPSLATSASLFSPEPPADLHAEPPQKVATLARAPQSMARKACISGLSSARWRRGRPPQARRPPRPSAAQGARGASAWRASLSFHQKKKVVAEPQPGARPRSPPPLDASWQASSMYALTPDTSLSGEEALLSDAQKVYRECQQDGPLAFSHYLAPSRLQSCEKIGEGVFGEVFRTVVDGRTAAFKVIAIEGEALVNGSPQKTFTEILPEIIISKELSLLSEEAPNRTDGFIGLFAVRCVQGAYPEVLLRAWDDFRSSRGSENERPDFFGPEQLYVVLEFEFGGLDLEHMRKQLSSVAMAKSLLHQVTAALAVAEAALRFEHRDLHWGNVLVKRTSAKELGYTLNGQPGTIATHGIHINIIDYTLSRLEKDGLVVFCDISQEPELFQGQGDYQFEIYRLMKKRTRNRWAHYHPYSNVLWLHYLADKVLKEMAFKKKATTAPMRRVRQQIQAFHKSVLGFDSATELLQGHSLFQ